MGAMAVVAVLGFVGAMVISVAGAVTFEKMGPMVNPQIVEAGAATEEILLLATAEGEGVRATQVWRVPQLKAAPTLLL